jgi:hypothetical protein
VELPVVRLRARRPEIERAVLTRVNTLADPAEAIDPEYRNGLRAAVGAALEYGLAGVERGEERAPEIPVVLLSQARLAARNGVSLDTVLRRYFAGYALMRDFLIEEAGRESLLGGAELKRLLGNQATIFDRLIAAISEEYVREEESRHGSSDERRAERVQRLLDGELLDPAELGYDFGAHHLGAVATGPGAGEAMRELAASFEARLLAVRRESSVWAWFGSRRDLDPAELERIAPAALPPQVALAVGGPSQGLDGWRLTHRQAHAALPLAMHRPGRLVRYADVALLASMLQDDLLATSLRRLYLDPLAEARDDGEALRGTLRAYFAAGRNVSSAAAALGVKRHTVTNRLRVVEELLDRPLGACAAELDAALRLEELGDPLLPRRVFSRT